MTKVTEHALIWTRPQESHITRVLTGCCPLAPAPTRPWTTPPLLSLFLLSICWPLWLLLPFPFLVSCILHSAGHFHCEHHPSLIFSGAPPSLPGPYPGSQDALEWITNGCLQCGRRCRDGGGSVYRALHSGSQRRREGSRIGNDFISIRF